MEDKTEKLKKMMKLRKNKKIIYKQSKLMKGNHLAGPQEKNLKKLKFV